MSNNVNTFLIDTGADVSIFKESKLKSNHYIDTSSKCKIKGIGKGFLNTLGTVDSKLFFGQETFSYNFQIIPDDFPLSFDEIIGLDFIKSHHCSLHYGNNDYILIKQTNNLFTKVPMFNSSKPNSLYLPARAEVIRRINVNAKEDNILIPNQEISDGILVARSIISRDSPYVKIINLNQTDILLENPNFETENLSDYTIYTIDQNQIKSRQEILDRLSKNFPEFVKR